MRLRCRHSRTTERLRGILRTRSPAGACLFLLAGGAAAAATLSSSESARASTGKASLCLRLRALVTPPAAAPAAGPATAPRFSFEAISLSVVVGASSRATIASLSRSRTKLVGRLATVNGGHELWGLGRACAGGAEHCTQRCSLEHVQMGWNWGRLRASGARIVAVVEAGNGKRRQLTATAAAAGRSADTDEQRVHSLPAAATLDHRCRATTRRSLLTGRHLPPPPAVSLAQLAHWRGVCVLRRRRRRGRFRCRTRPGRARS